VVENFGAYYMEQKKREVISKKKVINEEAKKENDASKTVSTRNRRFKQVKTTCRLHRILSILLVEERDFSIVYSFL
jgi:hypothetical protein